MFQSAVPSQCTPQIKYTWSSDLADFSLKVILSNIKVIKVGTLKSFIAAPVVWPSEIGP